jgi:HD superfamily phosphodiesterase
VDIYDFLGRYALPSSRHEEVRALIAGRFLKDNGYAEDKFRQIISIVSEHTTITQTTLESKIVADADKLDSLGATWVARGFQRTNAFDKRLGIESIPDKYLKGKEKYLNHFYSESARKMAAERYQFLAAFIEQFEKEMKLEA